MLTRNRCFVPKITGVLSSYKRDYSTRNDSAESFDGKWKRTLIGASVGIGAAGIVWWNTSAVSAAKNSQIISRTEEATIRDNKKPTHEVTLVHSPKAAYVPPARPDLPIYTRAEVAAHKTGRIWVSYSGGVYDITEFVESHPGGREKIMLTAGGQLEPFWKMYAQHKTPDVAGILEGLRIGTLDPREVPLITNRKDEGDPYAEEPERHPALLVNSETPFNAETPPALINDSFLTPQELFYVRNHLPVPKTSESTHKLQVEFGAKKAMSLNLGDLKRKFKPVTITAAVQCAGNRRTEMSNVKTVQGLGWKSTAIGNASWTGYRLKDILEATGADLSRFQHVICEGADKDMTGTHYETSITLDKALHPDTIVAFAMNGEPLSPDHGFPLRLIAPGIVGARQVKWIQRVSLAEDESRSHWQRKDYRALASNAEPGSADYSSAPSIQEGPIQSAISAPAPDSVVFTEEKEVEVKGYAWSGGGRGVIRVEVSADGGKTWVSANLTQDQSQTLDRMWAWTLWEATVPLPSNLRKGGKVQLMCRAIDRAYNVQPENVETVWNFRGLLNNSWHRISLNVSD